MSAKTKVAGKVWFLRDCLPVSPRVCPQPKQTSVKCALSISLCYTRWLCLESHGHSLCQTLLITVYRLINCVMRLCRSGLKISEQNIASRRNSNSKLKIKQTKTEVTQRHRLQGTVHKNNATKSCLVTALALHTVKVSIYCSQPEIL